MADGWKKPISEIKVSNKVLVTDPKPGEASIQTSSAVITGTGARDLVQLMLAHPRRGGPRCQFRGVRPGDLPGAGPLEPSLPAAARPRSCGGGPAPVGADAHVPAALAMAAVPERVPQAEAVAEGGSPALPRSLSTRSCG